MSQQDAQAGSVSAFAVDHGEAAPAVEARLSRRRQSWKQTIDLIRSDIAFRCAYENKAFTKKAALKMLMHPGVACVVRYRLQCFFIFNRMAPLGRLLKWYNLVLNGVSIGEEVRIGGGLFIVHGVSIVVHGDVEIGERLILFHLNTISPSPFFEAGVETGPVVIGNDVVFGVGACAYGRITIGDGCQVGANSAVERSFPAGSILFGVPARALAKQKDAA